MFKILQKTFRTGIVTIGIPEVPAPKSPAALPRRARSSTSKAGRTRARRPRPVPPAPSAVDETATHLRAVTVDYGRCIFCGECAADGAAVRMSQEFELAARDRSELVTTAEYELEPGRHAPSACARWRAPAWTPLGSELARKDPAVCSAVRWPSAKWMPAPATAANSKSSRSTTRSTTSSASASISSPRRATPTCCWSPVRSRGTWNWRCARPTQATPDPEVVVAVGACGISGGIFGENYAIRWRRGPSDPRGCLHPRLPAASAGAAARDPAGDGTPGSEAGKIGLVVLAFAQFPPPVKK